MSDPVASSFFMRLLRCSAGSLSLQLCRNFPARAKALMGRGRFGSFSFYPGEARMSGLFGCGLHRGEERVMTFEVAREFLLQHREKYERAYADFRWPHPVPSNWALDWLDKRLAFEP